MKRMVLAMAVLIALLVSACERDRDNNRYMTKLLHLEMDISGNISAENFPGFYSTVFGKPQWIRDDYLLFSKAKLYRGSWDAVDMIQLLPDSIDCFGYNISVSTSRERIWFCNAQGVWSCNFSGGDITHVYPSPMDVMQLSNRENYLVGVNMNDRSGLRLLDLATNTMEEHNAMGTIIKAFYNEDLGKFSYLTNLTNGKGVFQVRVLSRDGSSDQLAFELGIYWMRNFQQSADGRYVASSICYGGYSEWPLYLHDLQTGETTDLGYCREFQMSPVQNILIFFPVDGRNFKVSRLDLDTQELVDIHPGIWKDYRFRGLNDIIMREDGARLRIFVWGEKGDQNRRIM